MALPLTALSSEIAAFSDALQLTGRERQVLAVMAGGMTSAAEVAQTLGLSTQTVNNHVKNLLRRTGVHSKSALLAVLCDHAFTRQAAAHALMRPPRVLIARDHSEDLAARFSSYGFRAICAALGKSPVQQANDQRADVLLTDAQTLLPVVKEQTAPLLVDPAWPTCIVVGDARRCAELRPQPFAVVPDDIGTEDLVFTTLEACFQAPYERSRLLRVDADCAAVIDGRLWSRVRNLGFGGAFLELPFEHLADKAVVQSGTRLDVAFDLKPGVRIRAQAEVVWQRLDKRSLLPPGIGLRFLHLTEAERRELEQSVRRAKLSLLSTGALGRHRRED